MFSSFFSCLPSSSSLVCLMELALVLLVIRVLRCVLGWISLPLRQCPSSSEEGAWGALMHAVSLAATTLMILLSRRSQLRNGFRHAVSTEGKTVFKSLWILFVVCFTEWFRAGPSIQRLHTQGMWRCAGGGKVWVVVLVLGVENVGDGAV